MDNLHAVQGDLRLSSSLTDLLLITGEQDLCPQLVHCLTAAFYHSQRRMVAAERVNDNFHSLCLQISQGLFQILHGTAASAP